MLQKYVNNRDELLNQIYREQLSNVKPEKKLK